MMILLYIVGVYLIGGVIVLFVFESLTSKISANIDEASRQAQQTLISTGTFVSPGKAKAFTLVVTLIFWPAAIYGYIESRVKSNKNESGEGKQDDQSK